MSIKNPAAQILGTLGGRKTLKIRGKKHYIEMARRSMKARGVIPKVGHLTSGSKGD